MKKLVLLTAVVLTTISLSFAKNNISNISDINRSIPINLRASVLSVPQPLNLSYANGEVIFMYSNSAIQKQRKDIRPYTGLGNYYVNFSVSWIPENVYLTVYLDITTDLNNGNMPPYTWWNGNARASETFENYQTTFGINIYETNFYHLEKDGIIDIDTPNISIK